MIVWGIGPSRGAASSLRCRASSYTSVLGQSLMTANPPAVSPYRVEYPTAISDLLPVVRTSQSNLLDRAISRLPRIRAWMFSSVRSAGRPSNTAQSTSS